MTKKIFMILLAIALALSVGLIGCTTPAQQEEEEEEEEEPYGGTLRIILGGETSSMFPPEQISPEDHSAAIPALEMLWYLDKEGMYQPWLAESWEEDPDNLEISIYLKEGIKFQDGSDFNAEAVKWNIEQLKDSEYTGPSFWAISSVDAVDEYTVRVNLIAWDNLLQSSLGFWGMVSKEAYEENGIDYMRENPVGTGPFKLVSWQRDLQKVYEKWDGYWQEGKPYLDKIELNIIADPMVQEASFLAGENDILLNVNPTAAYYMKDNPNVEIVTSTQNGFTYGLIPDSANPDSPFSKLEVRQAMSYAINREAIADAIFRGYGEVTYQYNGPENWSYNPYIVGYPYDPDKARDLLEDAGYGDGFSTVIWYKSEQLHQDLYTAVQADLAAVGIDAELQPLVPDTYDFMYYVDGWIGGVFGAMTSSYNDIQDLSIWFWDPDSCVPAFAFSAIHPDDLVDIGRQAVSATDFESKKSLCQEMQYLLFDKYCLQTTVVLLPIMTAKSSKLRDEYTGTVWVEPHTYADAWIAE